MPIPAWVQTPPLTSWQKLTDNASSHRSLFRETMNAPQTIAPAMNGDRGITTADPRFHQVLRELADTLTEALPREVDSDGFGGPSAVIADFHSLRNLSGYYMSPTSVPMMSNDEIRHELNLADGFLGTRDEAIFDALHAYMFKTVAKAPLVFRKTASSGAPYFTSALQEKKKALAVFNEYAPSILDRFAKGDLSGLYDDYGLYFMTYMGVRVQPDQALRKDGRFVSKPREVNDELYSRSFGKDGMRRPADKRVFVGPGLEVDGLFAMRRRSVYAYPAMYNYWLTQFFTLFRAHYLNDAEFTFKHRDSASIAEKLQNFSSVRGFDVKQFDQSNGAWLLERFADRFAGFLREEVIFFLKTVLRQPFYQPHPTVRNTSGDSLPLPDFDPLFGDPFDLATFTMDVGLPSGIGPNPDIGKFVMTFAYLCLLDRHFHDVLETGVRTILRGEHARYALLDQGDDAVLATNDPSLWTTVEKVLAGPFYFRIEPEDGISFLGGVIYKPTPSRIAVAPNVVTFVRNRLCPEYGVQHWSRRDFAGTGYFEGKKHYSVAPKFGDVYTILDDVWRKHFKEGIDTRFFAAQQLERRRGVPTLSDIDRAVLENPDKLYYRYSIEEVHPWVLDQFVGTVTFEDFYPSIEQFFI